MNRRALCTVLLACVPLGCSDLSPEAGDLRDEIARNRALWRAVGPASYVYEVTHGCFCPYEAVGPVRVTVVDGVVSARSYVESGEPVDSAFHETFPAIDGLFDALDRAIDRDADDIQVTWDPENGVPLQIYIDYLKEAVDEEEGYTVLDGPRTTP